LLSLSAFTGHWEEINAQGMEEFISWRKNFYQLISEFACRWLLKASREEPT